MLLEQATVPGIETHLAKQSWRLQKITHPMLSLHCNTVLRDIEPIRMNRRPPNSFASVMLTKVHD